MSAIKRAPPPGLEIRTSFLIVTLINYSNYDASQCGCHCLAVGTAVCCVFAGWKSPISRARIHRSDGGLRECDDGVFTLSMVINDVCEHDRSQILSCCLKEYCSSTPPGCARSATSVRSALLASSFPYYLKMMIPINTDCCAERPLLLSTESQSLGLDWGCRPSLLYFTRSPVCPEACARITQELPTRGDPEQARGNPGAIGRSLALGQRQPSEASRMHYTRRTIWMLQC